RHPREITERFLRFGPDPIANLFAFFVMQQRFELARRFRELSRIVTDGSGAPQQIGETKVDPALFIVGKRGLVDLAIRLEREAERALAQEPFGITRLRIARR